MRLRASQTACARHPSCAMSDPADPDYFNLAVAINDFYARVILPGHYNTDAMTEPETHA